METVTLTHSELEKLVETIALEVARQMGPAPSPWLSEEEECACGHSAASGAVLCSNDQPPEVRALARLMDHTLLRPQATRSQIEQLADEARQWCFGSICVNPTWVPVAVEKLRGSGVKVAAVIGFPFGATMTSIKRAEAEAVITAGAEEVDMVMNIGAMRSGDLEAVENDIRGVVEVCHAAGALLKVILENAYLSNEEKVGASRIVKRAGADYVKTSTGFAPSGATADDVRLMRNTVGPEMGVKAAGGIRNLADAMSVLEAGATRLGTSASIAILEEGVAALGGSAGVPPAKLFQSKSGQDARAPGRASPVHG
jgi:deoxyribose-phosphate aldolase